MLMKNRLAALVDDREGQFRVDRQIYLDEEIFEAEMREFFEGGWIYLAHESQIRNPGDYVSLKMGRQPVFVVRKKDGGIGGYLNACSHRAATLVPFQQGKATVFTCRFHGWAFNHDGKCIKIKNEDSGAYPDDLKARSSLQAIPKLQSWRGFIFGSLRADVPSLADWLGPAASWIDLMSDQSPDGQEVLRGSSSYSVRGNWKLQAENGVDGYHVSTVHRVFGTTIANREAKQNVEGLQRTEAGRILGNVESGCYDFGNGHMGIWARRSDPSRHPLSRQKDRLVKEFGEDRVDWMLNRGRNLYILPNLFLMDNPSTQIRTLNPIAPDLVDVTVRCISPVGEEADARAARLRKFEDFYLTTGMSTSDDLSALEATHTGSYARAAQWNDFARGIKAIQTDQGADAAKLGFTARTRTDNWDHEALFHGFYRHWRDQLLKAGL